MFWCLPPSKCNPISSAVVEKVIEHAQDRIAVVGVGGIDGPDKARALLEKGCSAVQLYSGLIFKGPGLIQKINRGL